MKLVLEGLYACFLCPYCVIDREHDHRFDKMTCLKLVDTERSGRGIVFRAEFDFERGILPDCPLPDISENDVKLLNNYFKETKNG